MSPSVAYPRTMSKEQQGWGIWGQSVQVALYSQTWATSYTLLGGLSLYKSCSMKALCECVILATINWLGVRDQHRSHQNADWM